MADLFLAQNMGLLYSGALVPIVLVVGVSRGSSWSREIRFFTIATVLIAFYMFGWYTPVFRAMYELMPGVKLFRRPADATFVFGALIAILAGYLVHRWLTDAPASRRRAVVVWRSRPSSWPSRSGCRDDRRPGTGLEADRHRALLRGRRRRGPVPGATARARRPRCSARRVHHRRSCLEQRAA